MHLKILPTDSLPHVRILIADDEPLVTELISLLIKQKCSAEIVIARSGNEAIGVLANDARFDAIVSDLGMPDGNGLELYHFAKNLGLEKKFILFSNADESEIHPTLRDQITFIPKLELKTFITELLRICL